MHGLRDRMTVIEQRLDEFDSSRLDFPVATTCVVINLRQEPGEDIQQKCEQLIHRGMGLPQIQPKKCLHLKSHTGKTGVVKLQLKTKEDKEAILSAKAQLGKRGSGFERVYIRSSQTHERLIRLNSTQTLLSALPNGQDYCITMSGWLVKKDEAWEERRRQRGQQQQDQRPVQQQQGAVGSPPPIPPGRRSKSSSTEA